MTDLAEAAAGLLSRPSSPVWVTATLGAYLAACALQRVAGYRPVLNPVAVSVALVVLLLSVTGTSYETYAQSTRPLQFLLGPATVALAVPLYANMVRVRRAIVPALAAIAAGSATAVASAVLIAASLGAAPETTASLVPKSVTMPVAMAIADAIGGLPSLAAALVMLTGIVGVAVAPAVFGLLGGSGRTRSRRRARGRGARHRADPGLPVRPGDGHLRGGGDGPDRVADGGRGAGRADVAVRG